ncbi:MAG: cyclic nucleotide-binding and patatin-like phospholipase domain-containing protein [Spirochaetota bacterium]|nr:cyclic nucleotide-binding and patatin-like phospholipase domain-containing protein [Spirochaetota bacterium]
MNILHQILQDFPLFRHCKDREIEHLCNIGKIEILKKGQRLDLKGVNSLCFVIDGLLEIEKSAKRDVFFLIPGSFFGDIPFSTSKYKGYVKALNDSTLALLNTEEIYKFFLVNYRGFRGYIKAIERMGFQITEAGMSNIGCNNRIVTVYSPFRDCGKSIISSFLGLSLSKYGKTIILDSSFSGVSIFSIFEKAVTLPFSQKLTQQASREQSIIDEILEISENLALFNISFDSKVKVNTDIISPILLLLSKKYKYIIIDLSDDDHDLRDRIFDITDIIFAIIKRIKDREELYDLVDSKLLEGQRVYYTLNRYYAKDVGSFEGGYIFEDIGCKKGDNTVSNIGRLVLDDVHHELIQLIISKRRGLVLETNLVDSVLFTGLFSALYKHESNIDLLYSSSWGFFVISLFLLGSDISQFKKNVLKFFSEERINSFLDISFPDEYIFKNNKIIRFVNEIAGNNRLEVFRTLPVVMLTEEGNYNKRVFSTGLFRELLSASFLLYPIFEPLKIAGRYYNSGYPIKYVKVEDLFRMDVDEIIYASANISDSLKFGETRILPFYKKYIDHIYNRRNSCKISHVADKKICLEMDEKDYNLKEIIAKSEEIAYGLLE